MSTANFLRVNSNPSSRPLIKILKRTGFNMEPWETPLVTGLQLDLTPFTPTLWAQPHSQFLTQWSVHLSSKLLQEEKNHADWARSPGSPVNAVWWHSICCMRFPRSDWQAYRPEGGSGKLSCRWVSHMLADSWLGSPHSQDCWHMVERGLTSTLSYPQVDPIWPHKLVHI